MVFLEGLNFSMDMSPFEELPLLDENMGYNSHFYDFINLSDRSAFFEGLKEFMERHRVPMINSEFGDYDVPRVNGSEWIQCMVFLELEDRRRKLCSARIFHRGALEK